MLYVYIYIYTYLGPFISIYYIQMYIYIYIHVHIHTVHMYVYIYIYMYIYIYIMEIHNVCLSLASGQHDQWLPTPSWCIQYIGNDHPIRYEILGSSGHIHPEMQTSRQVGQMGISPIVIMAITCDNTWLKKTGMTSNPCKCWTQNRF